MIEFKTIGSDPEFVIKKNGKYIPSATYFDGTKEHPENKGNGFAILKDNLLVEGNIPPSTKKGDFVENMLFLQDLIAGVIYPDDAQLDYQDIVKYDKKYIMTKDGMEFGCSDYMDAWDKQIHPTPVLKTQYRPVGGHIHVGYNILDDTISKEQMNIWLARAWDYFVTLPSDSIYYCKKRRETYGKYGSYRDTNYGIEFRTLGGFFMKSCYLNWIYDQAIKTIDFCKDITNCSKLDSLTDASYNNYDFLGIDLISQVPNVKDERVVAMFDNENILE